MTPDISIIVVTYNSINEVEGFMRSLDALRQAHSLNIETIIVDDASKDGTQDWLLRNSRLFHDSKPVVIFNSHNRGLSLSTNHAISLANGETLLICNPDIVLDTSIVHLFEQVRLHPETGFCARLLNEDGSRQTVIYRRFASFTRIFSDCTILGRGLLYKILPQISDDFRYVSRKTNRALDSLEQAAGVCMAMSKKQVVRLAPFYDPAYPVFWNDVDMSLRARRMGIRFAIVNDALATHFVSRSCNTLENTRKMMLFFSKAGMIGFARKWGFKPTLLKLVLFGDIVYVIAMKPLYRLLRIRKKNQSTLPKGFRSRVFRASKTMALNMDYYVTRFRCSLL